jgi:hypothetical protein
MPFGVICWLFTTNAPFLPVKVDALLQPCLISEVHNGWNDKAQLKVEHFYDG